jgi:hypothetical protein
MALLHLSYRQNPEVEQQMAFWHRQKKEPPKVDHHAPPPDDKGWDSFALAIASGAGIIAVTVLEIEFLPALILGEVAGAALLSASERHEAKEKRLHDWHMSLLGHNIDRVLDKLLEKPVAQLTDRDRIQLALLTDWGLIDEERQKKMPVALKGEVLATQLTISAQQQGISILKLSEKFTFPRLTPEQIRSELGVKAMEADRVLMKQMLLEKKGPHWSDGIRERLNKSFVGKAVKVVANDAKAVTSAVGLAFEYPSLKKIWNILSAKGPANTAEDFMDRMAKGLQGTYNSGNTRVRCALRRHLRQAGVDYENVMVPKPEGGKKFVVRRKQPGM